jgi:hypothetical protein
MLGPAASGEICHGPAARCIMQQQSNNEPCNAIILAPPYVAPTSTAPSELFSSVRLPMPEATNVGVRTKNNVSGSLCLLCFLCPFCSCSCLYSLLSILSAQFLHGLVVRRNYPKPLLTCERPHPHPGVAPQPLYPIPITYRAALPSIVSPARHPDSVLA